MNESLKKAEEIARRGFIPHLEKQVLSAKICQEEAEFLACCI
jgi:hypothetical protein